MHDNVSPGDQDWPFLNPDLPVSERVEDLLQRMTLEEKVSQTLNEAPAIDRLNIPAYDWWNECLHGVARAGIATVFPQAIGLAATWNEPLMLKMAQVISDEGRAKHHEFLRQGDHGIYKGLTFWSPNINIFRDPRWGRGQETYGECPYLTARMGVAFCKGIQGDDSKYLKAVATPKHYAVHSGPEPERHRFDARVSPKDLRETYLPAFKACVQEAGAYSVMGAYNRTNGEPCCASHTLLQKILRDEWGFEGFVVSDCGAICDIHSHHKVTRTPEESAALAVNNGCDLNCGGMYKHLVAAVEQGLITEEAIDTVVRRLFTARFKLGMFDPPERISYAQIPYEVNDCPEHRQLSLQVARESMVLLKNEANALPLSRDLKKLAVIGPNADTLDVLIGNYFGDPSSYVTALEGIRAKLGPQVDVTHAQGCHLWEDTGSDFSEAVSLAEASEAVILCMGLSPQMEGEEGDVANSDGGGDKTDVSLPAVQERLMQAILATGKPVVLVLFGGSPIAANWADANMPAILFAWYPGQEGGTAIADVLFGDYSPSGRLPMTFVKSLEQLPPFEDYAMEGRTYRYMEAEPLYPFGYGLSYTSFVYSNLQITPAAADTSQTIQLQVEVKNTGHIDGDEVVQLYVTDDDATVPTPIRDLKGFQRVHLPAGESKTVSFELRPRDLALIDHDGQAVLQPGTFTITVGGGQPGMRGCLEEGSDYATGTFEIQGSEIVLPY